MSNTFVASSSSSTMKMKIAQQAATSQPSSKEFTSSKRSVRINPSRTNIDSGYDDNISNNGRAGGTSSTSTIASNNASSTSTPHLHDNLMRQQHNRDPLLYYEVVQVLGVGSMGSVSKVKKRNNVIGGSSRSDFVRSVHIMDNACFTLPIIGPLLRLCTIGGESLGKKKNNIVSCSGSTTNTRDLLQLPPPTPSPTPLRQSQQSAGESSDQSTVKSLPQNIGNNNNNNGGILLRRSRSSLNSLTSSSIITYGHNDMYFALKTINLDCISDPTYVEELKNEIEILKTLDHPNIVRPVETFDHKNRLYMVLELCSGGDLYTRDPYTESDAGRIVGSIVSAVDYMHSHNVVHRDLKYENIMFTNDRPDAEVKIIDFGLSKKYGPGDVDRSLHDGVGTIYTMAPEVLRGDYDSQADMWSVGVLTFMLLSSMMPFYGKSRNHVMSKIVKGKYSMSGRAWKKVSPYAKAFVMDLLQVDPKKRPTAKVALNSAWLQQQRVLTELTAGDSGTGFSTSEEVLDNVQATLETFGEYSMLKKLALMVVAHKSTSDEIGFLRKIFDKYDTHHHGMITLLEFKEALADYEYSDDEIEKMFHGANLDGTGVIHYTEFLAATIEAHGAINEERLAEAFDRLDSDDSGYISTKNLRELFGKDLPKSYIDRIIDEVDIDHDHKISYEEFVALWDQEQENKRRDSQREVEKRRRLHWPSSKSDTTSLSNSVVHLKNVAIKEGEVLADESSLSDDDFYLGESQFRQEKEMSLRRYEIVF